MRRRVMDIGAAAIGAALLVGVFHLVAVYAGPIVYPKNWTAGEVLTAADLNANFAAVKSVVDHNIDNSNLSPTAAIDGSRLADAPNGITTNKINDGAVTSAKILDGTITVLDMAPSAAAQGGTSAHVTTDGTEQDMYSLSITTLGRRVRVGALLNGYLSTTFGIGTLTMRVYRDGTLISYRIMEEQSSSTVSGLPYELSLEFIDGVLPASATPPAAGPHTYKITMQAANDLAINGSASLVLQETF